MLSANFVKANLKGLSTAGKEPRFFVFLLKNSAYKGRYSLHRNSAPDCVHGKALGLITELMHISGRSGTPLKGTLIGALLGGTESSCSNKHVQRLVAATFFSSCCAYSEAV
jgi:hypothetical protein